VGNRVGVGYTKAVMRWWLGGWLGQGLLRIALMKARNSPVCPGLLGGDGVDIRDPGERRRSCRGGLVVGGQPPAGWRRMADFIGREGVQTLSAARAEAIVPAIPAPKCLITAQTGGRSGIGQPWGRWLVHRWSPQVGVDAIKIKSDKFC
jgi:hypothetical protein